MASTQLTDVMSKGGGWVHLTLTVPSPLNKSRDGPERKGIRLPSKRASEEYSESAVIDPNRRTSKSVLFVSGLHRLIM